MLCPNNVGVVHSYEGEPPLCQEFVKEAITTCTAVCLQIRVCVKRASTVICYVLVNFSPEKLHLDKMSKPWLYHTADD